MLILGLGSNLGDRDKNLNDAIDALSDSLLDDIRLSGIYETEPLLPLNPEPGWEDMKFLNMAMGGYAKKDLSPEELLEEIKQIENKLGRQPSKRWAPRIIDIDILAWGNLIYSSPNLTIPHVGLMEREFAARPFAELIPDWKHPITGASILKFSEGKFLGSPDPGAKKKEIPNTRKKRD